MLRKMCMNVVFLCCVVLLSVFSVVNYPPLAGAQGVDSYTKLMLHADGADQGTAFTDSSFGAKTVTNAESYDSYTKLMLHIDNNLTDSAAGKTVTNNNVTFTSSAYKMGGYSGVFNGSNAYLSLADSDDWDFGSGDFTIDLWVRFNSLPPVNYSAAFYSQRTDGNNESWFGLRNDGNLYFKQISGGSNVVEIIRTPSSAITTGQWYHIVLIRNGSVFRMYVDGTQVGSDYTSSATLINYSGNLVIGVAYADSPTHFLNGYIDELRISKGIARWTSDFTPPSSPYGKVATVASQKKFGTASGEFHGSGDYLSLADSDDWNFGSGDFTVDGWFKANSLTGDPTLFAQYLSGGYYMESKIGSDGSVYFRAFNSGGSVNFTSATGEIVVGNWYHFAIVRNGSSWKIFKNGSVIASASVSLTFDDYTTVFGIGVSNLGLSTPAQFLNGWLDELRISKGIARWTSNFTPPSTPYETDTTLPTVSSTSPASGATGVGVSSAISATFSEDMDSSTITTSTFTLTSSGSVSGTVSYSNKVATFTPTNNLSYSTTYTATITTGVKDSSGNAMSSTYTWSFTTSSAPDTTAPSGSVVVSGGSSYTNSTAITLNLSVTDSVGVTGYYLSDSSSTPSASASGWNPINPPTTSFSATVSYTLSGGDGNKTIYAWYKDAAGNVSSVVSTTITLDTTAPTATISSPTSSSTYTATSSTISMGGSASDSVSGISSVTWSNNRGGNGTATGTASWTVSSISLSSGDNVITVTAKDGANNSGTDTLQVTYSTGTTASAPTVSTGSASSVTTSSATLNGTVNANGASTTAWFQYGSTSGSYGNTSSTQTVTGSSNTTVSIGISGLSSGTKYYYRIAASNSGGTSYGSESSFTTSTTTATPTPTPSPTATTPRPTPTATPVPTLPPVPPQPPGGGCFNKGSISIQSIDPPKGTVLEAGKTYTFTMTVKYEFDEPTTGYIVSFAYDADTYNDLDGLVEDQINVSSQTGEETISVTTKPSYYGNPVRGIYVAVSLVGKGFNCSDVVDNIKYTVNDAVSTTPVPTPPPVPGGNGIIFGFVNSPDGDPLQYVTVTLAGNGFSQSVETDGDGYYEFSNLAAGDYTLTYEKEGYQKQTMEVSLEEGEALEVSTITMEEIEQGKISGYVLDIKGDPIESVRLRLKGLRTKVIKTEASDADGFFEFTDLDEDTYIITTKKRGYRKNKKTVKLEGGESKEIEIELRKTTKRIKGLLLEEEIQ